MPEIKRREVELDPQVSPEEIMIDCNVHLSLVLHIDESETLKTTASKIPWNMNEVDLKHVILMSVLDR